jgi:hypothetical protein
LSCTYGSLSAAGREGRAAIFEKELKQADAAGIQMMATRSDSAGLYHDNDCPGPRFSFAARCTWTSKRDAISWMVSRFERFEDDARLEVGGGLSFTRC